MNGFKKKICFVTLLALIVGIAIVFGENSLTLSASQSLDDSFIENSFFTALFVEAFVTIHMSVFVLMPLSKLINRIKSTKIFIIMFVIRIIILIIGDFFFPFIMMAIDFMFVFLGAFIIVPLFSGIKSTIYKNYTSFQEYPEVEFDALSSIGFTDDDLLKRALLQQFIEVKDAVCRFDYTRLVTLCSAHQYMLYKNEMKLLEQVREKNEFVVKNVEDAKIFAISCNKTEIYVSVVTKLKCLEYVVNDYNKIVRGSDTNPKDIMLELKFIKKMNGNMVEVCPNCGAPVKENHVEFCGYCGTALNFRVGEWMLSNELRVYEK